jgi:NAD-dependent DNA ligase
MKFNCPYWSTATKLDLLAKWILIHSAIYYEYNDNIVTDQMYDDNCYQMVELMKQAKKEGVKPSDTQWCYAFKGFDGSTGFHLMMNLTKAHQGKIKSEAVSVLHKLKYKR